MYNNSDHDHEHDHDHNDHGHSHSHGSEGNGHAHSHSHSHSAQSPAVSKSSSLGPPQGRTRTHRYSPSLGDAGKPSLSNGYASLLPEDEAPPAAVAYAAAMPTKSKSEAYTHDSDPIALTASTFTAPLLITTTLILASLSHSFYRPSSGPIDAPTGEDQIPTAETSTFAGLLARISVAAAISSTTLFLTFAAGFVRQFFPETVDEGGGYSRRKARTSLAREAIERAVGIWGCYFATLELGGVRTAALVLTCLAAGLEGIGMSGLVKRKAVLGAMSVSAMWDIWRGTAGAQGAIGVVVAYATLFTVTAGVRNPWTQEKVPSAHGNKGVFAAACALGVVAFFGWLAGVESEAHPAGRAGLELLACIVGAAGIAYGEGVKDSATCAAGIFAAVSGGWVFALVDGYDAMSEAGLGGLALAALAFDKRSASSPHSHGHSHSHSSHDHSHSSHDHSNSNGHSHGHSHDHDDHHHNAAPPSAATKFLLRKFEGVPLAQSILLEKDSRRISYFMCLNFLFMLLQSIYGFLTGSLGLISDSVHMFFDCLALSVGICATVMSKWPPSTRYPYGLGKMDTLAGFANGIFLMLISIEIVFEALERLSAPQEMTRLSELFIVSIAGLAINMVGIFSFDHAHMHGGGGHSHSHGDGGHGHGNDNMHGIFLHILADALGSVSVVISTLLVHYTGWTGFDPLASMFIAILIFGSSVPLVISSARNLLLTMDPATEYTLREAISGISALPGVRGYQATRFWGSGDGMVRGVLHVTAEGDGDIVRRRVEDWLTQNVEKVDVTVVVEHGGEGGCWCRRKD